MESISENITKEELIYRLQFTPENDNWQVCVQSHLKTLIDDIPSGTHFTNLPKQPSLQHAGVTSQPFITQPK
jgi:hypothetical protein